MQMIIFNSISPPGTKKIMLECKLCWTLHYYIRDKKKCTMAEVRHCLLLSCATINWGWVELSWVCCGLQELSWAVRSVPEGKLGPSQTADKYNILVFCDCLIFFANSLPKMTSSCRNSPLMPGSRAVKLEARSMSIDRGRSRTRTGLGAGSIPRWQTEHL